MVKMILGTSFLDHKFNANGRGLRERERKRGGAWNISCVTRFELSTCFSGWRTGQSRKSDVKWGLFIERFAVQRERFVVATATIVEFQTSLVESWSGTGNVNGPMCDNCPPVTGIDFLRAKAQRLGLYIKYIWLNDVIAILVFFFLLFRY